MDFEIKIIEFLQAGRCQFLDVSFQVISLIASTFGFVCVTLFFLAFDRKHCFWFLLTYGYVNVIVTIVKGLVERVRPFNASDTIISIGDAVADYSFPSGHTALAVTIAIFMAYFLWKHFKTKRARVNVVIFAVVYVVLVGISRMYLGKHYLTDVLAGALIAAVVSVAGLLFMRFCQRHKEKRNESKIE